MTRPPFAWIIYEVLAPSLALSDFDGWRFRVSVIVTGHGGRSGKHTNNVSALKRLHAIRREWHISSANPPLPLSWSVAWIIDKAKWFPPPLCGSRFTHSPSSVCCCLCRFNDNKFVELRICHVCGWRLSKFTFVPSDAVFCVLPALQTTDWRRLTTVVGHVACQSIASVPNRYKLKHLLSFHMMSLLSCNIDKTIAPQ